MLVARIDPRSSGYTVAELPALYARVAEGVGRLPGVAAVSLSWTGAFSGRNRGNFLVEGYTPAPDERMETRKNWVTSDYFQTVGLAITQGRGFGAQDSANTRPVGVISETVARRYFPDQNPIGRRLSWGSGNFDADGYEIVGVVEDARYNDVRTESVNMTYLLATQSDRYANHVQVRVGGEPAAMINAVRNALRESEPRLAIGAIETLDEGIVRSMGVDRLLGWLTMTFGAAALGLACLGLYGTVSYAVRRRTAELGIRVALGANRAAVQWLIVREALLLGAARRSYRAATRLRRGTRRGRLVVRHHSVRSRCVRDSSRRARCRLGVRGIHPGTTSVTPRSDDRAADRVRGTAAAWRAIAHSSPA